MKPSNTLLALLCAFTMAFVSCNQNEPTRGDETQKNQPANPSTWSPAGHRYAAPYDGDDYGFYVYQFFSKDSVLAYQTIKSDYSLDEEYQYAYSRTLSYSIDYPTMIIKSSIDQSKMTFKDTTQFFYPYDSRGDYGLTYTLVD